MPPFVGRDARDGVRGATALPIFQGKGQRCAGPGCGGREGAGGALLGVGRLQGKFENSKCYAYADRRANYYEGVLRM